MSGLHKLRRLTLKSFRQDSISDSNYFGNFPVLEALELDTLSLKFIGAQAFKNLTKLMKLDFNSIPFDEIPVECFQYLPGLTSLYIKRTNIRTVYSRSFEKLVNLVHLDLSHNQLSVIEMDAFAGINDRLNHLDLSSNKLEPNSLVALSTKLWKNLQELRLSYNVGLSQMPGNVFQYMSNVQTLNLANIGLKHITQDLFTGLTNIAILDVSYNNIETIQDRSFYLLSKLYDIKLDYQFQFVSGDKALEITPAAFTGLEDKLVFLNLEKTSLKAHQFWNTLTTLSQLKQLTLSETKLSDIRPYAFYNNKNLNKIELNKNGMTYLNADTFRGLEKTLKEVSLNDNNLTTISMCVFNNFQRLDYIHLRNNPLTCDCRLQWLHTFIQKTLSPPIDVDQYVCHKPATLAGQKLYSLTSEALGCLDLVPEKCSDSSQPTDKPTTISPLTSTTPLKTNTLKLTIASYTADSVTVAWTIVTNRASITGFKLEYKPTTQQDPGLEVKIHPDQIIHTLYQLAHGTFYQICLTAEINNVPDLSLRECKTVQTSGSNTNTEGHIDNKGSTSDNTSILTGAIIATLAVVVLIAVGVCAVVKYKVIKLKELQFAMRSPIPRRGYNNSDDRVYVCTVPNEYSEIDFARIASKYNIKSPKLMQRQFGVDNFSFDNTNEASPYNTYQIIGISRRKNPYENDEEEVEDTPVHLNTANEEVHFKNDLQLRHSAPSRLDTAETKLIDRNSRPLPATPSQHKQQARSSTLKQTKQGKGKQKIEHPNGADDNSQLDARPKRQQTTEKY